MKTLWMGLTLLAAAAAAAAKDYSLRGEMGAVAGRASGLGAGAALLGRLTADLGALQRRSPSAAFRLGSALTSLGNSSSACGAALRGLGAQLEALGGALEELLNCTLAANETCQRAAEEQLRADEWVLKVVDAEAKVPAGIDEAANWWPGSWQECWAVQVPPHLQFGGMRYCSLHFHPMRVIRGEDDADASRRDPQNIGLDQSIEYLLASGITYGLCLPHTCTSQDINKMVEQYLGPHGVSVTCNEKKISVGQDWRAIIMICILSIFGLLMSVGTIVDVTSKFEGMFLIDRTKDYRRLEYNGENDGVMKKLLISFSIYTNTKKLMTVEKKNGEIRCIHGIRFLSMAWVVLGHTYAFAGTKFDNVFEYLENMSTFVGQTVGNGTLSVDSFFCMSGFLLTYLFLKEMQKTNGQMIRSAKFWFTYVAHRYIRLTPAYLLILGTLVSLSRFLSNGPIWPQTGGFEQDFCTNTWWANALYVNNFIGKALINITDSNGAPTVECFGHSWYLANDMQFHLLAPAILLALWFAGYWGLGCAGVVAAVSMSLRAFVTYKHDLNPTLMGGLNPLVISRMQRTDTEASGGMGWRMYVLPWYRISAYLVGVAAGYLYWRAGSRLRWRSGFVLAGWCASIAAMSGCVYGLTSYASGPADLALSTRAAYAALNRTVWAAGVAFIIVASAAGKGGLVDDFLSWNIWVPLSRLTYCAYLVHPYIIYYFLNSQQEPLHFNSHYTCFYMFLANIVTAYMAAYIFSMAFEAPIMGIERIFRKSPLQTAPPQTVENPNYNSDAPLTLSGELRADAHNGRD